MSEQVPEFTDRPLSGIRVVDIVHGPLAPITRYLAELGATVDRIAKIAPQIDLEDVAANAGKKWHDIPVDGEGARLLIAAADIIVADAGQPLDLRSLSAERAEAVLMTVSAFGSDTRLKDWQATGPVLNALSGELARSGIRGREPLLPPEDLAFQCAASHAAYVLVTALYAAIRTGHGDHIDFSSLDGAVQALDPGFGISGSATMGRAANLLSRDRPARGMQYPILRCADGHVRICLLAKRQWQAMFRWMGEPPQFASPEFDKLAVRYKTPELIPAIAAFFADKPRADLEAGAQKHGVPLSALLTFEECIATRHIEERGAVVDAATVGGGVVRLPNGVVTIDGARMGLRKPGDAAERPDFERVPGAGERPFEGLKVLDLGVIVVGAEQSRLFGDQGADVIKIESRAYPDGNRQSYLSYGMSVSFAAGHRNKRSLGINLRDPEGQQLFLDLAAEADVILSNFKPGTLQGLGLDYEQVAAVNPRIVMTDSSAFGASGPWSGRMGYGPLVRAATGLTLAWRYPDDPESFSDSVTIYPDHVAARVGAMATVALLIRRLRTGRGGTASIAQAEVMLAHFAADVARVSVGESTSRARNAPWGVYPAAGDDEWCVVTVRDDSELAALARLIGSPANLDENVAAPAVFDHALRQWISERAPLDAASAIQACGVPAAPMLRLADLPDFSYYADRRFFRTEGHPYLPEPIIAERTHARSERGRDALNAPAPLAGEQSAMVISEWLGLEVAAVDGLLERGVIEPVNPAEIAAATALCKAAFTEPG